MNNLKRLVFTLISIATIAACQKVAELDTTTSSGGDAQTIIAYAPGQGGGNTRVSFEKEGAQINLAWQQNDIITLYADNGVTRVGNWEVESINSDGSAKFRKIDGDDLLPDVTYSAVYPASDGASLKEREDETTFTSQTARGDNDLVHLDDNCRMKAASFKLGQVVGFEHQMSIFSVSFLPSTDGVIPQSLQLIDNTHTYEVDLTAISTASSKYTANIMIKPDPYTPQLLTLKVSDDFSNYYLFGSRQAKIAFEAGKYYAWNNLAKVVAVETAADAIDEISSAGDEDVVVTVKKPVSGEDNNVIMPEQSASNTSPEAQVVTLEIEEVEYGTTIKVEDNTNSPYKGNFNIVTPIYGHKISDLAINLPNAHVTVNGEVYGLTTKTSPTTTEIVAGAAVIGDVEIAGGNLNVFGRVTGSIRRTADNTDAETIITVYPGGFIYKNAVGEGCKVIFKELLLDNIDENNIPEGDTWTIMDEYASSTSYYEGLKSALKEATRDTPRTINLVFPKLDLIIGSALARMDEYYSNLTMTISAPNARAVAGNAFYGNSRIKSLYLPKATALYSDAFTDTYALEELTIALEEKITVSDDPFGRYSDYSHTVVTTHPSNVKYNYVVGIYNELYGPFKSVNGGGSAPIESITLSDSEITLYEGMTADLNATITPDIANKQVTWSSDKEDIAIYDVDREAVVALSAGTATITATSVEDSTKSASCVVTVSENKGDYRIGQLYPDDENPIGVVFELNESGTEGKIVNYVFQTHYMFWTYLEELFSLGVDEGEMQMNTYGPTGPKSSESDGMFNTKAAWDSYGEMKMLSHPFFSPIHRLNEKQIADFDGDTDYVVGKKNVWYLPAKDESILLNRLGRESNLLEQLESLGYILDPINDEWEIANPYMLEWSATSTYGPSYENSGYWVEYVQYEGEPTHYYAMKSFDTFSVRVVMICDLTKD